MANYSSNTVDPIEPQNTPGIFSETSFVNGSEIQYSTRPSQHQVRLSSSPDYSSLHVSAAIATNNDNTPLLQQGHRCVKREDYHGIRDRVRAWYLFPLHLLLSVAFTMTLVFVLNDMKFGVGETDVTEFYRNGLYQTQVTTLVSLSLVLIRFIAGLWSTLSLWRCCFILLEKSGLTLQHFSFTITWTIPKSPFISGNARKEYESLGFAWAVLLICLLALPAQFASPVASGSISWVPDNEIASQVKILDNIAVPGHGQNWDWYQSFWNVRRTVTLRSAAYASMVRVNQFNANQSSLTPWRGVPSLHGTKVNTTVDGIIIPYFDIQNWEWVQDLSEVPQGYKDALAKDSPALTISQSVVPMQDPIEGNAALLKSTPWNWDKPQRYPKPTIISEIKYAVVEVYKGNEGSCISESPVFGRLPVPPIGQYQVGKNETERNGSNCFLFARFNLTAGRAKCSKCKVTQLAIVGPELNFTSELDVIGDPLAQEVLNMMPETMNIMANMNATESSQIDRIDGWTKSLVVNTYYGIWTAMSLHFSDETLPESASTKGQIQVVRASVSATRMYIWLGLNFLMFMSGVFLMILQANCERKPVVDTVIAAVMLDVNEVLKEDTKGLCDASRLGEKDEDLGILRVYKVDGGHFSLGKTRYSTGAQ